MTVTLRHATLDDGPVFWRMWKALLEHDAKSSPMADEPSEANIKLYWERFRAIVRGRQVGIVLVAEDDGKPIGLFMAVDFPTDTARMGGRAVAICGEWVEPEYRRQGVAYQMEAKALQWAKDQGLWDYVVMTMQPGSKNKLSLEAGHKGNPNNVAVQCETWYAITLD